MEQEIEKKIKDLKEFIKQKTDQGTANYLGAEIRKICGMVETEALSQHDVSVSFCDCTQRTLMKPISETEYECFDCGKEVKQNVH